MKSIAIIAFVFFTSIALEAQTPAKEIVKVKGIRLAYPLICEWQRLSRKEILELKLSYRRHHPLTVLI